MSEAGASLGLRRVGQWVGDPTSTLPPAPPPLLPSAGTGASESSWPCLLSSATSFVCVSSSKTSTSLPSVVAAPVLFVLPISSTSYFSPVFSAGLWEQTAECMCSILHVLLADRSLPCGSRRAGWSERVGSRARHVYGWVLASSLHTPVWPWARWSASLSLGLLTSKMSWI